MAGLSEADRESIRQRFAAHAATEPDMSPEREARLAALFRTARIRRARTLARETLADRTKASS